jgi:acyl-CoA reductase-like NAD-dependent aldehyde dehydrogenase
MNKPPIAAGNYIGGKWSMGVRFIEAMPTGIVNINDTSNYWELHIPFGGISGKDSGIGRLGGRHTLMAMSDIKAATISLG